MSKDEIARNKKLGGILKAGTRPAFLFLVKKLA